MIHLDLSIFRVNLMFDIFYTELTWSAIHFLRFGLNVYGRPGRSYGLDWFISEEAAADLGPRTLDLCWGRKVWRNGKRYPPLRSEDGKLSAFRM